jgi:hypothetical protein
LAQAELDVENLPPCCRAKLEEIERILSSIQALEIILPIAPDLAVPRPGGIRSVISLLWYIARAGARYVTLRKTVHGKLEPIARERVRTVIDLHRLDHVRDRNLALEQQWARMREAYAP